jgi:hypothetical protein
MVEAFRERRNPGRGGNPIDIFEYRVNVPPSVLAVGVVALLSDEVVTSASTASACNSLALCSSFGLLDVSTSAGGGDCARSGVVRPEETGELETRELLAEPKINGDGRVSKTWLTECLHIHHQLMSEASSSDLVAYVAYPVLANPDLP